MILHTVACVYSVIRKAARRGTSLRRTSWNFAAAARLLGIQRTYLHQKAAALGIERPAGAAPPAPEPD
jgi:transcriptional regulator of acetoin/glycerol metabolism